MESYFRMFSAYPDTVIKDPWTFYPNDEAVSVDCTCNAVSCDGVVCLLAQANWSPVYDDSKIKLVRMAESLRHIPLAVTLSDVHGGILLQNPLADHLYGPTGTDFYTRFADAEQRERCRKTVRETQLFKEDVEVVTQSGHREWHEVEARTTRDPADGDKAILAYEINIEERRMLMQMTIDKERAVAENKLKSRFMAEMSHEVRTPLHGILGMAQLLRDTNPTPAQLELIDMMNISANSLMGTINNVLNLSRVERAGSSSPSSHLVHLNAELHPFPIRVSIENAVTIVYGKAQLHQIDVSWCVSDDVPLILHANPEFVQQCLINLLGNAIKFSPPRTRVSVVLDRDSADPTHFIRVAVEDQGRGVTGHWSLEDLCKPYLRAEHRVEGTGLGLSITKKLVEEMGGQLSMDTRVGQGSTFSFTLPITPTAAPSSGIQCTATSDPDPDHRPVENNCSHHHPLQRHQTPMMVPAATASACTASSPTLYPSSSAAAGPPYMDISPAADQETLQEYALAQPLSSPLKVAIAGIDSVTSKMLSITLQSWGATADIHEMVSADLGALVSLAAKYDILIVDTVHLGADRFKGLISSPAVLDHPFPVIVFLTRPKDLAQFTIPDSCPAWKFRTLIKPMRRSCLKEFITSLLMLKEHRASGKVTPVASSSPCQGRAIVPISENFPLQILVAEDDLVNQIFIRKILTSLGYTPMIVDNGQEVVDQVLANPRQWDLILMDINMPVKNGLEATQEIRQRFGEAQRPAIVGMTASTLGFQDDDTAGFDLLDDMVSKPAKINVIVETLKKWARARQATLADHLELQQV